MEDKKTGFNWQLKQKQSLPLEGKILLSQKRIIEWYEHYNGQVAVSFSGGKDSTVLLHLVRSLYPEVKAVFSDTGLEYPEIKQFVKTFDNVDIVRPKMTFNEVIKKYGYPIISKQTARMIWDLQHPTERNKATCNLRRTGYNQKGVYCSTMKLPKKWLNVVDNADFLVGDNCCEVMKKAPLKKYYKQTQLYPMVGVLAEESDRRAKQWKMHGCNAFDLKTPLSMPLAFWTEQDILQYIKNHNVKIASVYGDLVEKEDGALFFNGCQRTGCIFCGFGCHLEKEPNRFEMLAKTHPKLYDYCINGGEYVKGIWQPNNKGLGLGKVLDFIGVKYCDEKTNYRLF